MRVVLAGNPNAGKTTLFNALTKSSLKTGNFHGVTTSPAQKTVDGVTYIDVPGAYSFSPYSMEEKSACDEIESADLIVNVVDALTLKTSLNFTRGLMSLNKKMLIYITKTRRLARRGGKLDAKKLSQYLGVPVYICTPAKLKEEILKGDWANTPKSRPFIKPSLSDAYSSGNFAFSRADRLFCNKIFAPIFFVFAVTATFFLAFHPLMPGTILKGVIEGAVCDNLAGVVCGKISNPALKSLVGEGLFGGVGSVLSFIPQLTVLYLVLTLLDESGITSALAFTTDGLFERAGLSGRAAFTLVSGFGCTAAAIATTRGSVTGGAQKRLICVLPFIPCGAKMPVFLTLLSPLFENPFPVLTCLYFAGTLTAIAVSFILRGKGENMLYEIAPVAFPSIKTVLIKLYFYLKGFIIKVTGTVTVFCILSWTLSHFSLGFEYVDPADSMLAGVSRALLPLFKPMGVNDWRIAYAALCGFIAKENVAATIAMLCPAGTGLNMAASLSLCAFMLFCPACVSAMAASVREAGVKFTIKCVAVQLIIAFTGAYIVNLAATII